jgi:hypothetical protein
MNAVAVRAERNAALPNLTHCRRVIILAYKLVDFFIIGVVFVGVVEVDDLWPTRHSAVAALKAGLELIPLLFLSTLLLFDLSGSLDLIILVPLLVIDLVVSGLLFFFGVGHFIPVSNCARRSALASRPN